MEKIVNIFANSQKFFKKSFLFVNKESKWDCMMKCITCRKF